MEMYVDVYRGKDDKTSCLIYFGGQAYSLHGQTLEEYSNHIVKELIKQSDIIIYVDMRGLGVAMYDTLKSKHNKVEKMKINKVNSNSNWDKCVSNKDDGWVNDFRNSSINACKVLTIESGSLNFDEKAKKEIADYAINKLKDTLYKGGRMTSY